MKTSLILRNKLNESAISSLHFKLFASLGEAKKIFFSNLRSIFINFTRNEHFLTMLWP